MLSVPVFQFSIKNKADGEVDIFIDGAIVDASTQQFLKDFFGDDTSTSFKSFREQLNTVEANVFNVYINSPGGIVTDAMAIHDLLIEMQSNGKTVNTIGRGIIASAATYVLMAGKNSRMSKNSWFMIHNVGGGIVGDVHDIGNYYQTLLKFNNRTRDFYSEASGLRKEDITKMMNAETWLTADEAKEKGFIQTVDGEAKFTNILSEKWKFNNMAALNAYNAAVTAPKTEQNNSTQNFEEMKNLFQEWGKSILNAIKGVKQPENNDHAALMNSIGEAVQKSFEENGEKLETAISEAVETAINISQEVTVKTAVDAAVKTAVENATKDLTDKIADMETAATAQKKVNDALVLDITNLKAGKSATTESGGEKVDQMKGQFGS